MPDKSLDLGGNASWIGRNTEKVTHSETVNRIYVMGELFSVEG